MVMRVMLAKRLNLLRCCLGRGVMGLKECMYLTQPGSPTGRDTWETGTRCPFRQWTRPVFALASRRSDAGLRYHYCSNLLAHPICAKRRRGGLVFCCCFKIYFSDFCQTNYLNIYRTDLRKICRIVRTLAVDERSEVIFFRSLEGRCRGNQFGGQNRPPIQTL